MIRFDTPESAQGIVDGRTSRPGRVGDQLESVDHGLNPARDSSQGRVTVTSSGARDHLARAGASPEPVISSSPLVTDQVRHVTRGGSGERTNIGAGGAAEPDQSRCTGGSLARVGNAGPLRVARAGRLRAGQHSQHCQPFQPFRPFHFGLSKHVSSRPAGRSARRSAGRRSAGRVAGVPEIEGRGAGPLSNSLARPLRPRRRTHTHTHTHTHGGCARTPAKPIPYQAWLTVTRDCGRACHRDRATSIDSGPSLELTAVLPPPQRRFDSVGLEPRSLTLTPYARASRPAGREAGGAPALRGWEPGPV